MSWNVDCVPDMILDHKKTQKQTFGVITAMKVADKKIETKFEPVNPASGKQEKMPGILQFFGWDGGENNPITLGALVPEDVAKELHGLLKNKTQMKNAKVEFAFHIWAWDEDAGFWDTRHSDGKHVKGTIALSGGQMQIMVDPNKSDSYSIGNRKLHDFRLTAEPEGENHIHAGDFPKQVVVHPWGIKGADK